MRKDTKSNNGPQQYCESRWGSLIGVSNACANSTIANAKTTPFPLQLKSSYLCNVIMTFLWCSDWERFFPRVWWTGGQWWCGVVCWCRDDVMMLWCCGWSCDVVMYHTLVWLGIQTTSLILSSAVQWTLSRGFLSSMMLVIEHHYTYLISNTFFTKRNAIACPSHQLTTYRAAHWLFVPLNQLSECSLDCYDFGCWFLVDHLPHGESMIRLIIKNSDSNLKALMQHILPRFAH